MNKFADLYQAELGQQPCFTSEFKVRWEEMDVNGHVNYANYLNYYSEARIEAIGHEILNELRQQKIGPVVYKAEIDFNRELLYPDTVHIVTWISEFIGKTRVAVSQRIYSQRSKELVSQAKFHAIFMDTSTRKPVRMPNQIRERFNLK